jgi:hypothetical protein
MIRLPFSPAPALLTAQPSVGSGTTQRVVTSSPSSTGSQPIGVTCACKFTAGMASATGMVGE